jgi:hypothetical protein
MPYTDILIKELLERESVGVGFKMAEIMWLSIWKNKQLEKIVKTKIIIISHKHKT